MDTLTLTTQGRMRHMRMVLDGDLGAGACIDIVARSHADTATLDRVWDRIRSVLEVEAPGVWVIRERMSEEGD